MQVTDLMIAVCALEYEAVVLTIRWRFRAGAGAAG